MFKKIKILKKENIGIKDVYDIEVKKDHHYILKNGVISHNSGLKYAASIIIFLTAKKAKDKDNNVTGKYLTATAVKNRFCKEQSRVTAYLDFKRGLHPFYGLQDFGEPMLKKEAQGWSISGERIKEKQLWSTAWEKELLNIVNENINKAFAFGTTDSDVELTSELDETEQEE